MRARGVIANVGGRESKGIGRAFGSTLGVQARPAREGRLDRQAGPWNFFGGTRCWLVLLL